MRSLIEICAAFLAAWGLLTLCWLVFGRFLTPATGETTLAVVRASGAGERLEHDLNGLLWFRTGGLTLPAIVILDEGLDPVGLRLAAALLERAPGIRLCKPEELADLLKLR